MMSVDTVDCVIVDRVFRSLGLPGWFRHALFKYYARVRCRFKLAAGFGDPWTRDGGHSLQRCPLRMMSIVSLCLPWCRYLHVLPGVTSISPFPSSLLHQVHADNLECISSVPMQQMRAARFYSAYVRLVGQEPAPSECVLMSTSAAVRRDMKGWLVSYHGGRWLDVRDLGGHLDTTYRTWVCNLASGTRAVLRVVWSVGAWGGWGEWVGGEWRGEERRSGRD